jgi:hypothetical protein
MDLGSNPVISGIDIAISQVPSSADGNTGPATFKLLQNNPNPFNPSTIINFSIAKPGFVTLKVFDLLGREVATLVNDFTEQGNYRINFNAVSLPSGIYFYQLKAEGFSAVKKMILLK